MKVLPCDVTQDWTFVNNKCIKLFTNKLPWLDANAKCQAMNGRLCFDERVVVFHTIQELNNVINNVFPPTYAVWIGLTDLQTSRVWKWVDGTQLAFDVWGNGEPSARNQNCVNFLNGLYVMKWNHNLNDGFCKDYFDFLCEKEPREPSNP